MPAKRNWDRQNYIYSHSEGPDGDKIVDALLIEVHLSALKKADIEPMTVLVSPEVLEVVPLEQLLITTKSFMPDKFHYLGTTALIVFKDHNLPVYIHYGFETGEVDTDKEWTGKSITIYAKDMTRR